jgi:CBS domain-containing protein
MTRSEIHREAMLRHLGVTYYESLHGTATAADVSRALLSVESQTCQLPAARPAAAPVPAGPQPGSEQKQQHQHQQQHQQHQHQQQQQQQHERWHHRVRDVMTTSVVTVGRMTPYKEIAALLAEHKISAVPVLSVGRHVAGVVSEADLLSVHDMRAREARLESGSRLYWPAGNKKHWGLTAEDLMTSPAVTIHPDATLRGAARLMNSRRLKRLPVVEAGDRLIGDPGVGGRLVGIVSRCDLLSVFLRPDEDIAREVIAMLTQVLLADPARVTARVRGGVVTLAGQLGPAGQADLRTAAIRLTWDIDGVVDVVNKLGAVSSPALPEPEPGLPPSADTLPGREEIVANAYDFAEQMLSSQRKFAETVLEATEPLLGS